jgi:hypothetical protein
MRLIHRYASLINRKISGIRQADDIHSQKCRIRILLAFLFLFPSASLAQSDLDYQSRGRYFEGQRPKPVSGADIELISVLANYQEPAERLPDELRVKFYLPSQKDVYLTVREQDYRLYYWLDQVRPPKPWQAMAGNEFAWPTGTVLRQLDHRLNMYELGILVRLGKETSRAIEEVAPAILYHGRPPERIDGYLFTMKTNGDARISCKGYRDGGSDAVMTRAFQRIPGGRPFTLQWDVTGLPDGPYKLECKGYFLNNNDQVKQTIHFHHRRMFK